MRIRISICALVLAACGGGASSAATTSGGERASGGTPAGYHSITPGITVADVDAAIAFYERALGAVRTERVEGAGGAVVHAEIRVGDSIVMLSPEEPDRMQRAPASAGAATGSLMVYVADVDAAYARAIAAGAVSAMPPTEMFWGDRYGVVRDPSGHRWALATHRVDLSPAEVDSRGQAFSAAMAHGGPPPSFEGGTPATSYRGPGYFDVTPVLVVSGPDAIDSYVAAFGATERGRMLTADGRLMHGEVQLGDSVVMMTSEFPEMEADMRTPAHVGAATLTLTYYVPDVDSVFARAVAAGAQPRMPLADMFWGDRFGLVCDSSGQMWGLATHLRDVSPEEIRAAAAQPPPGS